MSGGDASGDQCDLSFQYNIVWVQQLLTGGHLDFQYGCRSVGAPLVGWLGL